MAKSLPVPRDLAGILFIIASGILPNLALGGGEEFHVSGVVYSIVEPHSVVVQHKRVVGPGQISVIEDRIERIRTVEFSTADEQRFSEIRSIHPGDHVTIDGVIMGKEHMFFTIRVDSSGGARDEPADSPEPPVNR